MIKINYDKLINSEDFENNLKFKALEKWFENTVDNNKCIRQLYDLYYSFYDIMEYHGKISSKQNEDLKENLVEHQLFILKLLAICPFLKIEINNDNMGA